MILRTGSSKRRDRRKKHDPMLDEEIALVEAATADLDSDTRRDDTRAHDTRQAVDRIVEQAMQQQDTTVERKRD